MVFVFIEILFKILLLLIYAEHCIYIYIKDSTTKQNRSESLFGKLHVDISVACSNLTIYGKGLKA